MPPDTHPAPPPSGMWGTIAAVFTSGNAVFILGTVVAIAVIFGVFAKLGIITIRHKGVKVGRSALAERYVLKRQIEYVQRYFLGLETTLAKLFEKKEFKDEGARVFYFKYLAMLLSNEAEKSVLMNHISDTPEYINMKCLEIKALIEAQVGTVEHDDALLEARIREHTTTIVKGLLAIEKHGDKLA